MDRRCEPHEKAGMEKDERLVDQASDILRDLSEKEYSAMKLLEQI